MAHLGVGGHRLAVRDVRVLAVDRAGAFDASSSIHVEIGGEDVDHLLQRDWRITRRVGARSTASLRMSATLAEAAVVPGADSRVRIWAGDDATGVLLFDGRTAEPNRTVLPAMQRVDLAYECVGGRWRLDDLVIGPESMPALASADGVAAQLTALLSPLAAEGWSGSDERSATGDGAAYPSADPAATLAAAAELIAAANGAQVVVGADKVVRIRDAERAGESPTAVEASVVAAIARDVDRQAYRTETWLASGEQAAPNVRSWNYVSGGGTYGPLNGGFQSPAYPHIRRIATYATSVLRVSAGVNTGPFGAPSYEWTELDASEWTFDPGAQTITLSPQTPEPDRVRAEYRTTLWYRIGTGAVPVQKVERTDLTRLNRIQIQGLAANEAHKTPDEALTVQTVPGHDVLLPEGDGSTFPVALLTAVGVENAKAGEVWISDQLDLSETAGLIVQTITAHRSRGESRWERSWRVTRGASGG